MEILRTGLVENTLVFPSMVPTAIIGLFFAYLIIETAERRLKVDINFPFMAFQSFTILSSPPVTISFPSELKEKVLHFELL